MGDVVAVGEQAVDEGQAALVVAQWSPVAHADGGGGAIDAKFAQCQLHLRVIGIGATNSGSANSNQKP